MGLDLDSLLAQMAEMMEGMDGNVDLGELAKALLTQDLAALENMIREAAEQAGTDRIENMLQVGFFSRRTNEQLDLDGAGGELEDLAAKLAEMGMGSDEIEGIRQMIKKLLENMRRSVKNFVER